MARFCTSCGSPMDDSAAFCPKCGKAAAGAGAGSAGAAPAPAPVMAPVAPGLTDNVAGALAYVTIIPAIIFLVVAPYNRSRLVRFHAFQSIFLGVAWFVLDAILGFTILFWPLIHLVNVVFFVLAVIAAVKAYSGQKWKLPVIGDIAEKQSEAT